MKAIKLFTILRKMQQDGILLDLPIRINGAFDIWAISSDDEQIIIETEKFFKGSNKKKKRGEK